MKDPWHSVRLCYDGRDVIAESGGASVAGADRRVHCSVTGIVQGVGFRYYTRDEALRLGLRGWVRNLDDGRVEVVAEGPEEALQQLVAWLGRGPRSARVDRVDTRWEAATGQYHDFRITR
jgi:acylphosphatase